MWLPIIILIRVIIFSNQLPSALFPYKPNAHHPLNQEKPTSFQDEMESFIRSFSARPGSSCIMHGRTTEAKVCGHARTLCVAVSPEDVRRRPAFLASSRLLFIIFFLSSLSWESSLQDEILNTGVLCEWRHQHELGLSFTTEKENEIHPQGKINTLPISFYLFKRLFINLLKTVIRMYFFSYSINLLSDAPLPSWKWGKLKRASRHLRLYHRLAKLSRQ